MGHAPTSAALRFRPVRSVFEPIRNWEIYMPIEYSYIENNGILLKGTGIITAADVSMVNKFIYETPQKIKKITYQLCDYTEIEGVNMSSNEVRMLSKEDATAAKINSKMIIAVVGKEDLIFGLLRMWQAYANETPFETSVFRNVEDAKYWIAEKLEGKQL